MQPRRILIADDDSRLTAALACRLESMSYEVAVAADAYQAVDMAVHHRPDVLLLDVNMPAGSGMSVPQRLRGSQGSANIPVIYMTGESKERVAQLATEYATNLGAATILRKPFDIVELQLALADIFEPNPDESGPGSPMIEYIL